MKKVTVCDLIKPEKQEIYIKDGTATTVGELIDLLSTLPRDYSMSLCGIFEYAVAVDDINKAILIDEAKWIDEHVYQLNEENRRIDIL